MIRMNPMHDTKNPPGQARSKTIGDIIDKVVRSEATPVSEKEAAYWEGYNAGYQRASDYYAKIIKELSDLALDKAG